MQIVIKIPEGLKNEFESEQWTALSCMEMKDALIHGKPLPKGHGQLVDMDAVLRRIKEPLTKAEFMVRMSAEKVLEADKEVDE